MNAEKSGTTGPHVGSAWDVQVQHAESVRAHHKAGFDQATSDGARRRHLRRSSGIVEWMLACASLSALTREAYDADEPQCSGSTDRHHERLAVLLRQCRRSAYQHLLALEYGMLGEEVAGHMLDVLPDADVAERVHAMTESVFRDVDDAHGQLRTDCEDALRVLPRVAHATLPGEWKVKASAALNEVLRVTVGRYCGIDRRTFFDQVCGSEDLVKARAELRAAEWAVQSLLPADPSRIFSVSVIASPDRPLAVLPAVVPAPSAAAHDHSTAEPVPISDGPQPPNRLIFRGRESPDLRPLAWKLLDLLWPAECLPIQTVVDAVWGEGASPSENAVKKAIHHANAALFDVKAGLQVTQKAGYIILG